MIHVDIPRSLGSKILCFCYPDFVSTMVVIVPYYLLFFIICSIFSTGTFYARCAVGIWLHSNSTTVCTGSWCRKENRFNGRALLPLMHESEDVLARLERTIIWVIGVVVEKKGLETRLIRAIILVLKINCWEKNNSTCSGANKKGFEKWSGTT